MIRVVLDTNVLVSAALTRSGAEAYVLDLAVKRRIQVYVTQDIRTEYEEVLGRAKFRQVEPAIRDAVLRLIRRVSIVVSPQIRLSVSPDEEDNRFHHSLTLLCPSSGARTPKPSSPDQFTRPS